MSKSIACALVCFGVCLSLSACSTPDAWEAADAQLLETPDTEGWDAIGRDRKPRRWSGGVTAAASDRPGLPNAGLQLPRVSPDGRWVAFLDADEQVPRIGPGSWVTGRGLLPVSLWLRAVEDDGLARNIALSYAAWPTWSADGSALVFVSHDPDTGCALGIHDVAANRTERLAVGLKKMLTPAVSPDGRHVAVAGYGELPDQALLFVIDLATGQAEAGPPPTLGGAQLAPCWISQETLVFVELDERGGGLMRWTRGDARAEPIAPLRLPTSIFDAIHLHAGVPAPVSPDGQFFTYYLPGQDRMDWIGLDDGSSVSLASGDRAGAWWNDQWFLVANDDQLALVESPQAGVHGTVSVGGDGRAEEDSPRTVSMPRMNLLPGRWVPVWADPEQRSMLLVGQGETPERFRFLQLWVITK